MPHFASLSETTESLSNRVFSDLMRKARALEKAPYPLHVGDIWRTPIAAALAENQRVGERPRLHNYSPVQGLPDLLAAIGDKIEQSHGYRPEVSCIQVTTGATGGLNAVCQALLSPGDEVLLPSPYWPLIRGIIAGRGARAVELPIMHRFVSSMNDVSDASPTSLASDKHVLALDELEAMLEAAVTPRTVAVYLNTPHNPTGAVLSQSVLEVFARVAERHNLWVMVDEAYEDLWFGDGPPSRVTDIPEMRTRSVVCHTLSKSYGLAGIRVGYVHGPAQAIARIRGVQTFQYYSAPTPMQWSAVEALRGGDDFLRRSRELYREAGSRTAATLSVPAPSGGTFLFFDTRPYLSAGATSALPLLERLLASGVLLTPGASCGADYGHFARICFSSLPPSELDSALAILRKVLHG